MGYENYSNLLELLRLRSSDSEDLKQSLWSEHYLHPEIQNETIQLIFIGIRDSDDRDSLSV